MNRLAICYYGETNVDVPDVYSMQKKFPGYKVTIFSAINNNKFVALSASAYKKRLYEIHMSTEFDICLAIDTSALELLEYTMLGKDIKYNFIYYIRGFFNYGKRSTGVNPEIFYSESLTFDRAAEFNINLEYIDIHWIRGGRIEELFYYHLKTLSIRTECINRENSDLFIRSA